MDKAGMCLGRLEQPCLDLDMEILYAYIAIATSDSKDPVDGYCELPCERHADM
jgi:hypothetical protein